MIPPRPWMVRSYPPRRRWPNVGISTWSAPFARPRYHGATLIHRVRYVATFRRSDGSVRLSAHYWCGTFAGSHGSELMSHADGIVCATCEGRAIGAGQIPQKAPPVVAFRPRCP